MNDRKKKRKYYIVPKEHRIIGQTDRCPVCRCTSWNVRKTIRERLRNGILLGEPYNGSKTQLRRCKNCGRHYVALVYTYDPNVDGDVIDEDVSES